MRAAISMLLLTLGLAATPAIASSSSPFSEKDLAALRFHQKIGSRLPLDALLVDESGRALSLGAAIGHRPTVLVLDYLHCQTLCGFVLLDLDRALSAVPLVSGQDYEVVAISIDPRDTPHDSRAALVKYLESNPKGQGWHFLTGDEKTVRAIATAVGFPYRYDAGADQYAHPAGVTIVAPDGIVVRYILGLDYETRDFRLALTEAAKGTLSTVATDLLLLCYCYDPARGRYSANITELLRVLAAVTVLSVAGMIGLLLRKGPR